MMRWNWYRRGDTRDVVRRRGGVDLERVWTSCFPRPYAFVERLAPAVAAMGDAAVIAHRLLLGCDGRNKTQQERRRDDARGPHNTYGAGGGGWFEERFSLRRTDCCSARDAAAEGRAAKLFSCQLSVPAARISRAAALCRFARA